MRTQPAPQCSDLLFLLQAMMQPLFFLFIFGVMRYFFPEVVAAVALDGVFDSTMFLFFL